MVCLLLVSPSDLPFRISAWNAESAPDISGVSKKLHVIGKEGAADRKELWSRPNIACESAWSIYGCGR